MNKNIDHSISIKNILTLYFVGIEKKLAQIIIRRKFLNETFNWDITLQNCYSIIETDASTSNFDS